MRRGVLIAVAAFACLASGLFSAAVLASPGRLGGVTTITLPTTTITTTTPTTGTTTTAPRQPQEQRIAAGVTVGKTDVGGMTAAEATAAVQTAFEQRLVIRFGRSAVTVSPRRLGATPRVRLAVDQARRAAPFARIPLFVSLRAGRVARYVKTLARRFDQPARDAELVGL